MKLTNLIGVQLHFEQKIKKTQDKRKIYKKENTF